MGSRPAWPPPKVAGPQPLLAAASGSRYCARWPSILPQARASGNGASPSRRGHAVAELARRPRAAASHRQGPGLSQQAARCQPGWCQRLRLRSTVPRARTPGFSSCKQPGAPGVAAKAPAAGARALGARALAPAAGAPAALAAKGDSPLQAPVLKAKPNLAALRQSGAP